MGEQLQLDGSCWMAVLELSGAFVAWCLGVGFGGVGGFWGWGV